MSRDSGRSDAEVRSVPRAASTHSLHDDCGDYIARSDSCQRHCESRPSKCLRVTTESANAKRRATPWAHDEFIGRLEGYLTTGEEDIGMSFTKTIKDMYPDSLKKHTH